ncbi:hypothetical protein C6N19_20500 [Acinetobacter pittii]|nr:hypothetical protein C6N19_20500 [Acinetobacter pittii]
MTATDAAGNAGTDTAVVTIDTTAPNAPVLDPINATDPVSGTAEPGSTVGTTATVVAPDGTWSQTRTVDGIPLQQQLTLQAISHWVQMAAGQYE